jgi:SHS2 domain-containing protein
VREPGFELLEHTADALVVAHGPTLAETFAQMARGMYALMVDLEDVRETEVAEVTARGETPESLLTNWLLELLFRTEMESMLFRRFDVEIEGGALMGRAYGEPLDEERHDLGGIVKGVTRHMLEIAPEDGGYRARVLFDM